MTEQIKRRLIGIAVMVLVALAIAAILPEPRLQPTPDEGLRVVTIPLQEPRIAVAAGRDAPAALEPEDSAAMHRIAGDEGDESARAPIPTAVPTPRSTPRPTPPATPRPTVSPTPTPISAVKPSPALAPTPLPTAARATPSAAIPLAGVWWVQIGSYADIGNAREVEARVAALGQPTVMAPIEAAGTTLYRVRAGPYATETRAQEAHALITRSVAAEARLIKP